jgi:hypothetical protein
VTIILVAVTMVFMIMALAAIAIDVVALYTARSEANHAAAAAAMAGAKTLANSGMTSDPTNANLQTAAKALATQIATTVATQNKIGGQLITTPTVSFPNLAQPSFVVAPQVAVTVQRTDLPTFFARAAGYHIASVGSTSVAEAFNPSTSSNVSNGGLQVPIAPKCVKPWILPNMDPTNSGQPFFDPSGAIHSTGMVGKSMTMVPACAGTGCTGTPPSPPAPTGYTQATYYFGDFIAPPATSLPASCGLGSCAYEQNIAACSPQPITCGVAASLPNAQIDPGACGPGYRAKTRAATQCLIHDPDNDTITLAGNPPPFATPIPQPMQFITGDNNPLVESGSVAAGAQVSTSDSLVTIPVSDQVTGWTPNSNVNIIGFIQAFIVRIATPATINVVIVNMSGCGTSAAAPPVIGDGISPVPVHLISQ